MNENENYDVVVVGGGAAGLSGAVALARSRRSVLVVDAGDPRNAPAGHVHNFLSRDGTPPSELYAAGRAVVRRYGVGSRPGGSPPWPGTASASASRSAPRTANRAGSARWWRGGCWSPPACATCCPRC